MAGDRPVDLHGRSTYGVEAPGVDPSPADSIGLICVATLTLTPLLHTSLKPQTCFLHEKTCWPRKTHEHAQTDTFKPTEPLLDRLPLIILFYKPAF